MCCESGLARPGHSVEGLVGRQSAVCAGLRPHAPPRPPLEMEGGTVFHFVTAGIEAALDQARAAAQGKDVRIGGGAATIRQYLQAGLLDEIHLAISPSCSARASPCSKASTFQS